MDEQRRYGWCGEFQADELAGIRKAIPRAIQASQDRSARAQAEYADPDSDQDVYGVGMSRGVQKELRSLLLGMPTYHEEKVPRSRRTLTFVGSALIFPHRVGKRMPRSPSRIRLDYLPESRRDLLEKTSNVKYTDPGLFEVNCGGDQLARLEDALDHVSEINTRSTLFVPYYSSTSHSVGTTYFAPARLNGQYLEFTDPERLTYQQLPPQTGHLRAAPHGADGFSEGERPRTSVVLRPRPTGEKHS